MAYSFSSFDVCMAGNERLRNRNEFILVASINGASTLADLKEQWLADIQACERPEHFDYDGARAIVDELVTSLEPRFSRPNPFDLEIPADEDEEFESCTAYLYIADDSHEFSIWGD